MFCIYCCKTASVQSHLYTFSTDLLHKMQRKTRRILCKKLLILNREFWASFLADYRSRLFVKDFLSQQLINALLNGNRSRFAQDGQDILGWGSQWIGWIIQYDVFIALAFFPLNAWNFSCTLFLPALNRRFYFFRKGKLYLKIWMNTSSSFRRNSVMLFVTKK